MLRLVEVKELEEKRKALAQESDLYRETLKLQVHNLQLYAVRTRQRFSFLSPSNPWMMVLGPLLGAFIRRRGRSPKMRLIAGALFAWKLFKKFGAVLPALLRRKRRHDEEETAPLL